MPLWNIIFPANASLIFKYVYSIATYDIFPTENLLDRIFPDISKTYLINKKFELLGYNN